jgi:hypothetical protein
VRCGNKKSDVLYLIFIVNYFWKFFGISMTSAIRSSSELLDDDSKQYALAEPRHYEEISQLIQEIEQKRGQTVVLKSDLDWYKFRAKDFWHLTDKGFAEKHADILGRNEDEYFKDPQGNGFEECKGRLHWLVSFVLKRTDKYFKAPKNSEFEECKAHLQGVLNELETQVMWSDPKDSIVNFSRSQSLDPLSGASRSDCRLIAMVSMGLVAGSVAGLAFLSFRADR